MYELVDKWKKNPKVGKSTRGHVDLISNVMPLGSQGRSLPLEPLGETPNTFRNAFSADPLFDGLLTPLSLSSSPLPSFPFLTYSSFLCSLNKMSSLYVNHLLL